MKLNGTYVNEKVDSMSEIHKYEPLWGSWKVERQLGEGSYGKVYEVSRSEFGIVYTSAVKIISIPQQRSDINVLIAEGMDEGSIRGFYRWVVQDILKEIDLMQKMKGTSNIVCIEDHSVIEMEDEIGFDILIRMELLESLTNVMMSRRFSEDEVVNMSIDLCKALELCASYKLIHRDVKPDNIFVSSHGNYKLGDFGIARQIERTAAELSRKGSYTYMAPEVYNGQPYNASVDLYSLGIVMYRLLNQHRAPFMPENLHNITPEDKEQANIRRMAGEEISLIKNVKPELSDIVLKACAFDRNKRYSSPSEMKEALLRMRVSAADESISCGKEIPQKVLEGKPIAEDTAKTGKKPNFEYPDSPPERETRPMPSPDRYDGTEDDTGQPEQPPSQPRYRKIIFGVLRTTIFIVVFITILPIETGTPVLDNYPYISPTPTILPTPSITLVPLMSRGIPSRFPAPSSWPRNAIITLNLHGIGSTDMLDQPSASGNLVETISNDASLEYLSIYEKDADSDVVYWLKVRSTRTGNEGYIRSPMSQVNIHDYNEKISKLVAFNRHGWGWIRVYGNDGGIVHVEYNLQGDPSWYRIIQ